MLSIAAIGSQLSYGLLFEARNLTDQEKGIAEKDYLSIIQNCNDRLVTKIDSGEMCDAFMSFYIKQCDAFDNLLSYCNFQLQNYEITRPAQEMCIKQNTTKSTTIFCGDYLNLNVSTLDKSFKRIETSKLHLSIPSSTIYNNTQYDDFPPYIMGEVLNNYTYPVEQTRIFARIYDTSGNVIGISHNYTQDSYLKPGQRSGFWILLQNPISEISNYSLTSEFEKSSTAIQENLQLKITFISNPAQISSYLNPPQISGTVTNLGKEIATNVKITGTFYDANHKVVDVAYKVGDKLYEFYNIAGIFPGREVPFTIQPVALNTFILGRTGTSEYQNMIKSYSLNVISSEYSMKVP